MRTALGLTLVLVMSIVFTGVSAPKPAEANDTGKILAGLAAGALVYGLLDGSDNGRHGNQQYQRGRSRSSNRGYYNGNSRTWDCRPPAPRRQPSPQYRPPRRPQQSNRRSYERGYDNGWGNGYNTGRRTGYNQGYDRGYDRGYDNGWSDRGWSGWCY